MSAAEKFDAAITEPAFMLAVLLRDTGFDEQFKKLLPHGVVVQPQRVVAGVSQRDFGYRAVVLPASQVEDFVRAVRDAGVAEAVYKVEPRALSPVYVPSPVSRP